MSYLRYAIIIFIWLWTFTAMAQNGGEFSPSDANYRWPISSGEYLSSTFGETRSAHFHSALDIKTWGRKGYEVYATRDAILHRIAIGPTGYGKVIYLKHEDGSYSVYAHLLRFEESIQQIADSLRFQDYSFELDRNLEHLNIDIKQGEVIALSGASGIGPPHLHFELRTPDHRPFNPLLTNLSIKDTIAPKFSNISIEPLSIKSSIEGANRIYTKRAWRRNSSYTFGTINVSGPVGLGVDVFDQANEVYNAYAVYELKMYVDGELRFNSTVDSFSYDESGQMFVDRVYPILKESRAGFQRLYVADGNTLPFYESLENDGKLNLPEGTHEIKIVASDFFGNTREANLTLRVRPEGENLKKAVLPSVKKDSVLHVGNWSWFESWVNIPQSDLSSLTIAELGESGDSTAQTNYENRDRVRVKLNPARDIYFRSSADHHFIARQVVPEKFAVVPSTVDQSFAAFQAHTFYDTLSVGLRVQRFKTDSMHVQVFPSSHPIKKEYKLAVEIDSMQMRLPHLGLYQYNKRKDKLNHTPSYRRETFLMANPEEMGTFYILQDTTAPEIENPKIVQRRDGQWLVYVTVRDNLSGIDYQKSIFHVNGTRGIAEYEPEDNRLVYYHPDFKPAAENELHVTVFDKEGHKTEESFKLSINNSD